MVQRQPVMRLQEKFEALVRDRFYGVPVKNFEFAGREQLDYLLNAGLKQNSKVLDIGCGVLRAGYWLTHFLDPGCYCGIEPHKGRLEFGMHSILEPEILKSKSPRFDCNPNFDTSVFREKFDFFLAYSIWTHASKGQIQTMLNGFVRDSNNHASFLLTFLPSGWRHPDYNGDQWVGTSHESEVAGTIAHSFRWIKSQCAERELTVRKLSRDKAHRHGWLEIRKVTRR
jgi:hypothetical protein